MSSSEVSSESILPSKIFYVLGQYSKFIRPDYVRISANLAVPDGGDEMSVLVSAYTSPKSGEIVIVLTNMGAMEVVVSISDAVDYDMFRTSGNENIEHVGRRTDRSPVVLPRSSVTTMISVLEYSQ